MNDDMAKQILRDMRAEEREQAWRERRQARVNDLPREAPHVDEREREGR